MSLSPWLRHAARACPVDLFVRECVCARVRPHVWLRVSLRVCGRVRVLSSVWLCVCVFVCVRYRLSPQRDHELHAMRCGDCAAPKKVLAVSMSCCSTKARLSSEPVALHSEFYVGNESVFVARAYEAFCLCNELTISSKAVLHVYEE